MNRTDYLNSIIPAEHAEYCFIEWRGRGGWCLHFYDKRHFGDDGIDFLGRDWKAAEKQLHWIYGIKEKPVVQSESGREESQAAARRVMARIPGAVEIAPGSWRHRPIVSSRNGVKLPPVTNAKAGKSIAEYNQQQGDVQGAKNRVVGISAGESQQQLAMFENEVSHVG